MSIPKATFSQLIKEFKIKELFNELGWDNATAKYPITVDPPNRQTEGGQEDDVPLYGMPKSGTRRAGSYDIKRCSLPSVSREAGYRMGKELEEEE